MQWIPCSRHTLGVVMSCHMLATDPFDRWCDVGPRHKNHFEYRIALARSPLLLNQSESPISSMPLHRSGRLCNREDRRGRINMFRFDQSGPYRARLRRWYAGLESRIK